MALSPGTRIGAHEIRAQPPSSADRSQLRWALHGPGDDFMLTGSRLGPYEVLAKVGEGGMGEVYRAHDTKLQREVALKTLPEVFARDPDRLMRFEREARTLASLNHPHIAQVYGIEDSPSTGSGQAAMRALVMELVAGEDLSARITRLRRRPAIPLCRGNRWRQQPAIPGRHRLDGSVSGSGRMRPSPAIAPATGDDASVRDRTSRCVCTPPLR